MPDTEAPASVLRRAAERMRADAKAAESPGPWLAVTDEQALTKIVTADVPEWIVARSMAKAAPHIAGMHPGVAEALADWLDSLAEWSEQSGHWALHSLSPGPLRFALAYLHENEENPDDH